MKVDLFIPCLVDQFLPEVGLATADCLSAVGCDVSFPGDQTCCGQMFWNSGMKPDAAALARRFVRRFAESEAVVAPSRSCVEMVTSHYGELLGGPDLTLWESLRDRVFELTDFITGRCAVSSWRGRFDSKAVLHWSCHMPMENDSQDRVEALLGGINGLDLVDRPAFECCGFGGVFWSLWSEVSASVGRRRLEVLTALSPDTILLAEPGCLMQVRASALEAGADVRVMHVAEVMSEALR